MRAMKMNKRILAALLCGCLLAASLGLGEGLLPSLTTTYGVAMPSLINVTHRYPDAEEDRADGSAVETWTGITEADFTDFGKALAAAGCALEDYTVSGESFHKTRVVMTIAKEGRTFTFTYDTAEETAELVYPAGTYDEILYGAKAIWTSAGQAYAAGNYDEAAELYASLKRYEGCAVPYRDSDQQESLSYYTKGETLREAQDWDGAVRAFSMAGRYSDAPTQIRATYYAKGEALREAEDWNGAIEAFTQAGRYSDAKTQVTETHYRHAAALYRDAKYDEAYALYLTIAGYNDVDSLLQTDDNLLAAAAAAAAARKAKLASFQNVGGYVTLGHYEQDNNNGNGKEEIEWLVLDYDEANHRALLISRYGLNAKPYNTSNTSVTWDTCTLRTWLNSVFLNAAFTADERAAILTTTVDNSSSQGFSGWSTNCNNTQDKIFLLSYAEANQYFGVQFFRVSGSDSNTRSRVAPTAYARAQGAYTSSDNQTADGKAAGWWWLRSPGYYLDNAAIVDDAGALIVSHVLDADGSVRPAFWINLESDIF